MKKRNFKIAIISGIVISFMAMTGCKDSFLYTNNPNQTTANTFWTSEANVDAAMASVYSPMRVPLYSYWGAFTGFQDINGLGDDILTIPGGEPPTWQIVSFINDPNNSDASSTYQRMFECIYRANLVIINTPNVPNMSQGDKTSYIAEAKFMRGLAYFVLVSNYGDVPLRTQPAVTNAEKYIPSTPAADVWLQVEQDFKDAAAGLPVDRPAGGEQYGRATSGAALAYLGKSYLFQKKYDSCEATLLKLTTAPYHYGLLPNYEDNFTSANKTNNPEAVFQWVYGPYGSPYSPWGEESKNAGMYNYIPQLVGTIQGGGWFKYVPSNYIIDQFFHELRPAGSSTVFDKRMYTDFFWKRSNFGETDTTWYGNSTFDQIWNSCLGTISRIYPTYDFDTTTHGKFLIRKFTNAWEGLPGADNYWGPTPSTANYVIMRYAEVLLNLAEAEIQDGNLQPALDNINQIRVRAGLPAKAMSDFPNADSLMAELQHQDLLEFFFEQKRWNDLKRWYNPTQLQQLFVAHEKQGAANFSAKYYEFPIPASEIQTNPAIKQNPLWQ
jgi:hypothetical protein